MRRHHRAARERESARGREWGSDWRSHPYQQVKPRFHSRLHFASNEFKAEEAFLCFIVAEFVGVCLYPMVWVGRFTVGGAIVRAEYNTRH